MIKYFKYMLVAAITLIAATGCQKDLEDTFSTNPAAPQLLNNGAIWMTQNTMSENVVWTWSAARFMQGDVNYSLYAQYGESVAQIGSSTADLTVNATKIDFHKFLEGFVGSPVNGTYDLVFYVEARDEVHTYVSDKQNVKVYAYKDAVSPVAAASVSEVVLDITTPAVELELLTWEPARLAYGEEVTYNVTMAYEENDPVNVATDLTATSCVKTVDEWNELAISAGAPEAETAEVKLTVTAFSESYSGGIPAAPVAVKITTYLATYPDCMYLPGSYQGWKPEIAPAIKQSTTVKGLYAAFVDLTTADGSDVEFKFSPEPAWGDDFGSDDFVVATDKGFVIGTGASVGSANIKVPSGLYHIALNKKLNTIEMVQINSIGMIGGFNNWNEDLVMEYDAATNTYSAIGIFTQGDEYKFRANADWTYAIGADGLLATSADNCVFEKESGEYKVILNVNCHPYTVQILSTSFPTEEYIYVPGNHQGWAPEKAPALKTAAFDGVYTGFCYLDGDFKFTKERAWSGEYNSSHFSLYDGGVAASTNGSNLNMSTPGFYQIVADVMNASLTTKEVAWGIIGPAQAGEWATDTDMTYNKEEECWEATIDLVAGEFKFRANDDWGVNVGGSLDDLVQDGGNIICAEAGTYELKLYLNRSKSDKMYCTMTKK